MRLTKEFITNRINRLLITFKESWENIVVELDSGIMEINSWMSTKFPLVSEVMGYDPDPEQTYSYNVGGKETPFFNNKYFLNIVIPFAAAELLSIDEEFGESYTKYKMQVEDNLFVMVRDELHKVHHQFTEDFKGVYFADPHPVFKQNPEQFFNKRTKLPEEKYKITYNWGNFNNHLPYGVEAFVSAGLPVDQNLYEKGNMIPLSRISNNIHNVFLVDVNRQVVGVFIGWSLSNDNERSKVIDSDRILVEDQDIKVYGVFDLDIVGIKYNGNGGTLMNWKPQYVPAISTDIDVITPYGGTQERTGFIFKGFNPPSIPQSFLDLYRDRVGEFTFDAKWEKEEYEIKYIYKGGEKTKKYKYGEIVSLITPPTNPINPEEFIGWWDNPDFEGDPIEEIKRSDHGNKTFYAKYNSDSAIVEWVVNRNDEIYSITRDEIKGSVLTEVPIEIRNNINANPEFEIETEDGFEIRKLLNDNEEIELFDETGSTVTLGSTIIRKRMTIYVRSHFKEYVMVTVSIIDDHPSNPNGTIPSVEFVKGTHIDDLEDLLNQETIGTITPNFEYQNTTFFFLGFDTSQVILSNKGRLINNSTVITKYTSVLINFEGFKAEYKIELDEEDLRVALSWDTNSGGNAIDALNWDSSGVHTIEDAVDSLMYDLSQEDFTPGYSQEVVSYENPLGVNEKILKSNALYHFNNKVNPQNTIDLGNGFILYYQNEIKYRIKGNTTIKNFPEELDMSVLDITNIIQVFPVYDWTPPIQPLMMFGFTPHIAEIKYGTTILERFYESDLNHNNKLEINFSNYTNNLFEHISEGHTFEGYSVDGTKVEDQILEYDLSYLVVDGIHKTFVLSPIIKVKAGYEIKVKVDIEEKMLSEISSFMSFDDLELYNKVLKSYKESILNQIDPNPRTYSYLSENNSVNVFTENQFNNLFPDENKFVNLKNKFTTGMKLDSYEFGSEEYLNFPVSVNLPESLSEVLSFDINLKLSLGNELGYKRIFISDEVYLDNAGLVEIVSLSDIVEDYKELFISVPIYEEFINHINLSIFQGIEDIKFYDYYDNEITNSIITENTYVKIRARRV